ncbi:MAG TPA: hypothetical protein VGQ53_18975 [Chitinophagaceae bacterium]|jgi:hypothetical protein|nr:hypothetical protein [Chitinophagaceae bacterium]
MDKTFFRSSYSTYTDEQLLEVVKNKANMQPDAVSVAGEILTSRGKQKDIEALGGLYTKPISDIDKRISSVKIYWGLAYVGLFLLVGTLYWYGFKPGTLGGVILIAIVTVPFRLKLSELNQLKEEEEIDNSAFL